MYIAERLHQALLVMIVNAIMTALLDSAVFISIRLTAAIIV